MVRRMALRAAVLSPVVVGSLWLFGGSRYALSGAVGLVMTIANLWLSARIIGGVADHNHHLLLVAGLAAFALGLASLTAIALLLERLNLVFFPVTGLVLVGAHLFLVLAEASGAYARVDLTPGGTRLKRLKGGRTGAEVSE